MSFLDQLGGMVNEFEGGAAPAQAAQVAQQASASTVAGAFSTIFNSAETGSFGQNIGQLFSQSNPQQRAGILNQLLASAAPGVLGSLAGGAFAGVLGQKTGAGNPEVTEEQAAQIPDSAVAELANHAQQNNPGIVAEASQFYSQHPALIQALGAGAAALALRHFSQRA